jgi:hypothetical protein
MLDPNRDKKIEAVYHELKNALDPPKKISMPYYANDSERKQALIDRVMQLYPGQLDSKKAVYKVVHGFYNVDDPRKVWSKTHGSYTYKKGSGILHYPFAFEIMAVPYNDSALEGDTNQSCKILGFVNYSISPRSNNFEGDYEWLDKNGDYTIHANDVPAAAFHSIHSCNAKVRHQGN